MHYKSTSLSRVKEYNISDNLLKKTYKTLLKASNVQAFSVGVNPIDNHYFKFY